MVKQIFRSECTLKLGQIRPNSTFLTIKKYKNNFGEISDFSVAFHINYLNAIKKAKSTLLNYNLTTECILNKKYSLEDLKLAKEELLSSFDETLSGFNSRYTNVDTYAEILSAERKPLPGVKLHINQDVLHLYGFRVHKKVLVSTIYPEDKRGLLTLAKDDLRTKVGLNRFVQFKLIPEKFERFVVENITVFNQESFRN